MTARNKIPCSADRLGLLDPPMIQGVVDGGAFHIGKQYLAENRVRIVRADESQITSAVIGNSGLYEQTIRLKDGYLISKCSCTLPEEPICRHGIAVLLEYHRWSQPRQARKPSITPEAALDSPATGNGSHASGGHGQAVSADLKLNEVMQFMAWLQPAMAAIEQERPLPALPSLGRGEVAAWMQAICRLDERRREGAAVQANLESDLRDREAYIDRLTQQLQTSMADVKSAQAKVQEQQQTMSGYQSLLTRVAELAGDVGACDGQLKSMAEALGSRIRELEKLAGSCRSVSDALKAITKAPV